MTTPPAPASVDDRYQEANDLYHRGRYPEALERFEALLADAPDHEKAREKAVGLLRLAARDAIHGGDVEGGLERLRRAWAIGPTHDRQHRHIRRTYLDAVSEAIGAEDFPRALKILAEVKTIAPDSERLNDLRELLEDPPTGSLDAVTGPSPRPGSADLVIVDRDVDFVALHLFLRRWRDVECYADRPLSLGDVTIGGVRVRPITSVASVGLSEEVELAHQANALSAKLQEIARREIPDALQRLGDLDLLGSLSYEIDSAVFGALKRIDYVKQILDRGTYARVIFVLGDGRMPAAVAGAAAGAVGPEHVWAVRCSAVHRAYDPQPARFPRAPTDEAESPSRLSRVLEPLDRFRARRRAARSTLPSPALSVPRGRRTLLIASPSTNHTSLLAPVARELVRTRPVTVIATSAKGKHRPYYMPYEELAAEPGVDLTLEYRFGRSAGDVLGGQRVERRILGRAFRRIAADERVQSLTLHGGSIWPVVGPAITSHFTTKLLWARWFAAEFAALIAEAGPLERPHAVVVARDRPSMSRLAAEIARRQGIPSIATQPYLFSTHPMWNALETDYVTVVDEYTRRLYLGHFGARPEQVHVTGIPRFDPILQRRSASPEAPTGRTTVLLVLQRFSVAYAERFIRAVGDALAPTPDVDLVVRTHPSEADAAMRRYQQVVDSYGVGDRFRINHEGDIYDVVPACDVIVAAWSTTILEAAMFGRLVLVANLSGEEMPVPFVELGVGVGADSEDEIREVLPRLLHDEAFIRRARERQAAYFAENAHLLDRSAAAQIAAVVDRLEPLGSLPPRSG